MSELEAVAAAGAARRLVDVAPSDPGGGIKDEDALARQRLRVWIRMVKATRGITAELRERLRREFEATLPQFDVLAALYRSEKGLKMSALSEALMVSNGNVTGIVDRLIQQGLVVRAPLEADRRASIVRLTARGRQRFERMAERHRAWVSEALAGLGEREAAAMIALLEAAQGRREKQ